MRNSASRSQINDGKETTVNSAADKTTLNKDGEEVCRNVNMQTFKSIYGYGLNVKFVKLLFILLKKQIDRFVEHKNSLAKNNAAAQKKKCTPSSKKKTGASDMEISGFKRPMRHSLAKDLEE